MVQVHYGEINWSKMPHVVRVKRTLYHKATLFFTKIFTIGYKAIQIFKEYSQLLSRFIL